MSILHKIHLFFKTYRKCSIKNLIEKLQRIDSSYNSVMIVDDNFLADRKRIHKIMDSIIEMETDIEICIEVLELTQQKYHCTKK